MKKLIWGAMASGLLVGSVQAEGMYLGIDSGLLMVDFEERFEEHYDFYGIHEVESESESGYGGALRLTVGGEITRFFALEGFVGMGYMDVEFDSDSDYSDYDYELSLDRLMGVNAVGILPLGRIVELYGKIGYVSLSYEDKYDDEFEEKGVAFGVGAKFNTGSVGAVTVDYYVLPDASVEESEDFYDGRFEYEATVESAFFAVGYQFNLN